eukprot:Hpha_TRINITY_DN845_c0_g1::TRINITY_DN845_c0_g1_i1::g.194908::m.194908
MCAMRNPQPPARGIRTPQKKGATARKGSSDKSPAREQRDWEERLRDVFSADLVKKVRALWETSDVDKSGALSRDELMLFVEQLYDVTGTPSPPYSVLRQEIIEVYRRYDLDRNMLIEVTEMCYYLRGSHFARSLHQKHRAKVPVAEGGEDIAAGSGAQAVRRRKSVMPWFQESTVISETTVNLIHPDMAKRLRQAVQVRKRKMWPAGLLAAESWADPERGTAVLAEWVNFWEHKEESFLDELANGLKGPAAGACYAQLQFLSSLKTGEDTSSLLQFLLAVPATELDVLMGWEPLPPPPAATPPPASLEMPEEEGEQPPPPPPPEPEARNLTIVELLSRAAVGGADAAVCVKTLARLYDMARPPPADLRGKELILGVLPADAEHPLKGSDGVWLPPGFVRINGTVSAGETGEIVVKLSSLPHCIDLRPMGLQAVIVPPCQLYQVEGLGKGVMTLGPGKELPDSVTLRKLASARKEFTDKQLEMIKSILHEKGIQFACACFTRIFNPSGSGRCSKEEFVTAFRTAGEPILEEDVSEVFAYADTSGDGWVDAVKFASALLRPPPGSGAAKGKPAPKGKGKPGGKAKAKDAPEAGRAGQIHEVWKSLETALHNDLNRHITASKAQRPDRYLPSSLMRGPKKTRVRDLGTVPMQWEEGDVLQLAAGEQKGQVVLETNFITIRGPAKGPRAVLTFAAKAGQATLVLNARRIVIENVDIVCTGDGYGVHIKGGYSDLHNCTVSAVKGGILCGGNSQSHIKGCTVRDVRSGWGICMRGAPQELASGIVENCTLSGCQDGGIVVERYASPWIGECRLTGGKGCGAVFCGGGGVLRDCEVSGNECSGIYVEEAGNPIVFGNKIHSNGASGIKCTKEGKGIVESNELWSNADNEVESTKMGAPIVRGNIIRDGKGSGIQVYDLGRGFFFENEVRGYPVAGIAMGQKAQGVVRGNRVWHDSKHPLGHAVAVRMGAMGMVTENLFIGWDNKADQPRAVDNAGDHDCHLDGNWAETTLEDAKSDRRRWLFSRFGSP